MDNEVRKTISDRLYEYGAYSHKDGFVIIASALIEQTEVLREITEELVNIRRELRDIDLGMNGAFC